MGNERLVIIPNEASTLDDRAITNNWKSIFKKIEKQYSQFVKPECKLGW